MMTKQAHFCEHSLARATYARPVFFLDAGEGAIAKSLSSFLLTERGHQLEIADKNFSARHSHFPLECRQSYTELIIQVLVMLE